MRYEILSGNYWGEVLALRATVGYWMVSYSVLHSMASHQNTVDLKGYPFRSGKSIHRDEFL